MKWKTNDDLFTDELLGLKKEILSQNRFYLNCSKRKVRNGKWLIIFSQTEDCKSFTCLTNPKWFSTQLRSTGTAEFMNSNSLIKTICSQIQIIRSHYWFIEIALRIELPALIGRPRWLEAFYSMCTVYGRNELFRGDLAGFFVCWSTVFRQTLCICYHLTWYPNDTQKCN